MAGKLYSKKSHLEKGLYIVARMIIKNKEAKIKQIENLIGTKAKRGTHLTLY